MLSFTCLLCFALWGPTAIAERPDQNQLHSVEVLATSNGALQNHEPLPSHQGLSPIRPVPPAALAEVQDDLAANAHAGATAKGKWSTADPGKKGFAEAVTAKSQQGAAVDDSNTVASKSTELNSPSKWKGVDTLMKNNFDSSPAAQGHGSPWLAAVVLTVVGTWVFMSLLQPLDEEADKDTSFQSYAKSLAGEGKGAIAQSSFWLCFDDATNERRYLYHKARDLMTKVRVLCVAIGIFGLIYLLVSVDKEKKYVLNKAIYNWTSPATVTFNVSCIILIALCGFTFWLTTTEKFRTNQRSETYIAVWLMVVMGLTMAPLSRWHVSHIYGGETRALFDSFPNDERLVEIASALIVFICLHMPLRFVCAAPICFIAPFLYLGMCMIIGTAGGEIRGVLYSGVSKESGHVEGYEHALDSENTNWLLVLCALCLFGMHTAERRTRADFVKMLRSFEMVQELQDADSSQDDGSTAMGRARKALKIAVSGMEKLQVNSTQESLQAEIKDQLQIAVKTFKNVDKLFEVDADQVVGDEFGDDDTIKAYINANMGGASNDRAEKRERAKAARLSAMSVDGAQSMALGSFAAGNDESADLVTTVVKAAVLAKGWGEEWAFDALSLDRQTNGAACIYAGECALVDSGHGSVLNCSGKAVRTWIRSIHSRYLPNSYHNEAHACQVTHMCKWFAEQTGWTDKADSLQMCALMLAGLAHDVGHIGRTNLFAMNAWHSFSLIWNDHAVLENMHAATCFAVMKGNANIMGDLDQSSMARVRKHIVRFILATDIKEHHASLVKLKARMEDETFLKRPDDNAPRDAFEKFDEDVAVAGEALIKSSDIGQGMLPWKLHKEWSYRVVLEFFQQGDEEKSLGLTVSPLCERKGYNIVGGQAFFIDVLCKSLFQCLVRFADIDCETEGEATPEKGQTDGAKALEDCLELGAKNKELWKEEAANFDSENLSMAVIEERFGKNESITMYPYMYPLEKIAKEPVSTQQNLLDIAEYHNSVFETVARPVATNSKSK